MRRSNEIKKNYKLVRVFFFKFIYRCTRNCNKRDQKQFHLEWFCSEFKVKLDIFWIVSSLFIDYLAIVRYFIAQSNKFLEINDLLNKHYFIDISVFDFEHWSVFNRFLLITNTSDYHQIECSMCTFQSVTSIRFSFLQSCILCDEYLRTSIIGTSLKYKSINSCALSCNE